MKQRTYIAIDLKSFYASVECRERNLDPLDTNLVVADESRTDKTICLAVTPSLKSYGISGRGRLFEVKQRVMLPSGVCFLDALLDFKQPPAPGDNVALKGGGDRKADGLVRPALIRNDEGCVQRG